MAAPSVAWTLGTTYSPAFRSWPDFANGLTANCGYTLVTFNNYSLAPGVMFYDFVPSPQAQQLEMEAALGVALGVGLALHAQQVSVTAALGQIEGLIGLGIQWTNARMQLAWL